VEAVNAAVLTPDVQAEIMADAEDVFEELAGKNRVRVVVHRDVPAGRTWEWSKSDLVHDSWTDKGEVTLSLLPQVVMLDELRVLAGRKPKYVDAVIRRTGGEFRSVTRNLRVNTGIDYVSSARATRPARVPPSPSTSRSRRALGRQRRRTSRRRRRVPASTGARTRRRTW